MIKRVAKKYLHKLCLDYPSVGFLIGGDEWAEEIIERAILEAFREKGQLMTSVGSMALSSSTNYAVANLGGN